MSIPKPLNGGVENTEKFKDLAVIQFAIVYSRKHLVCYCVLRVLWKLCDLLGKRGVDIPPTGPQSRFVFGIFGFHC